MEWAIPVIIDMQKQRMLDEYKKNTLKEKELQLVSDRFTHAPPQ